MARPNGRPEPTRESIILDHLARYWIDFLSLGMPLVSESHLCASSWATGPGRPLATITATTSETPEEMPCRPRGKPVDASTAMLISIPLLRIAREISPLTGS